MISSNYQKILKKVFEREACRDYSLEKMNIANTMLGNPLANIKVIHIAGTNGKGSVSKMLFSIFKEAGKTVGVFTSPHLVDIRERWMTQKGCISKKDFITIVEKILGLKIELSYFEICTLVAFLFFQQEKVEYAIIEVGFGGLLDSTNIVNPYITAITSIGYDHTDFLGNTLEEISFQKAGIIKTGIPIVINHKNNVIEKIALEKNSPIVFIKKRYKTNLLGGHQEKNAGIAYAIAQYTGINNEYISEGLLKVEHHGRLEKIRDNIYIDGAHNLDGLKSLKHFLAKKIVGKYKHIIYIFSLKKGKDISLILNIFGHDKEYIIPDIKSSMLNELLFEEMKKEHTCVSFLNSESIIERSKKEKENFFIIFGSLYMIGEFLKYKK